jgi:hypothetical protein
MSAAGRQAIEKAAVEYQQIHESKNRPLRAARSRGPIG